jgi:valyl-tRNA synthetase
LEKEERKFSELLQAIDRKLAAPGFSERAPAPVVAAEREKQNKYNDQLQATRAALGELRNSK